MGRRSRSAVLVAALSVLVAGCVAHRRSDYQDLVNSSTATADRAALWDSGTNLLVGIAATTPTLNWSPIYADQYCGEGSYGLMGQPSEATCVTRIGRIAGFDGVFDDEVTAFDAAARQRGWRSELPITMMLTDYYQQEAGKPTGSDQHPFTINDLGAMKYTGPHPTTGCHYGDNWEMNEGWQQAGIPPGASGQAPSWPGGIGNELFNRKVGPDLAKVESAQLATHHYVVIVYLDSICDYTF